LDGRLFSWAFFESCIFPNNDKPRTNIN
jgi:hypothetical protein